jgi:hypothetical protein
MTASTRSWCAQAQYEGWRPFHFGTVHLIIDASHHDIEAALTDLWGKLSPHPCPKFCPVPGVVTFHEEGAL